MRTLLFLLLAGAALADTITVGPIPITGHGSWQWDYGLGIRESISASGSNCVNSVLVSFSDFTDLVLFVEPPLPVTFSLLSDCPGGTAPAKATLNGLVSFGTCSDAPSFRFSIGAGTGALDIVDSAHPFIGTVIEHADLIGFFAITSYSQQTFDFTPGGNRVIQDKITFDIIQTPEPSTASMLIGAFLLLVGWRSTRRVPPGLG